MNVSGASTTLVGAVQVQRAPVIGQRMQDRQRVVAGFDDLVEVADRAGLHRSGERPVGPHDVAAGHHETADEIRTGQIVVAADGDHGPAQQQTHVLDESGLAAPRRAGEHDGYVPTECLLEQLDFIAVGEVGLGGHLSLDRSAGHAATSSRWTCANTRGSSSTRRMRWERRGPKTSGSGSTRVGPTPT